MENKNQDPKLVVVVDPVYTLDKNKVAGVRDFKDKTNYLYKDGTITNCPFMSGIGMDWTSKQHGLLSYPCGSSCQHFHIKRDMKKTMVSAGEGKEAEEKSVPTGKIKVGLSCGSSGVWFDIAGVVLNETPVQEQAQASSPLKITKTVGEEEKK